MCDMLMHSKNKGAPSHRCRGARMPALPVPAPVYTPISTFKTQTAHCRQTNLVPSIYPVFAITFTRVQGLSTNSNTAVRESKAGFPTSKWANLPLFGCGNEAKPPERSEGARSEATSP